MKPGNKSRSRRLRKKLHIGEFQELGFSFETVLARALDAKAKEACMDAFLAECIEPADLAVAGWIDGCCVCRFGRGSVSEAERAAVLRWLRDRPEFASVQAGPLCDAWYEVTELIC